MFTAFNSHITFYTSYLGFNYVNTIGFILICLYVIQLISGLQLSLYYNYSLGSYAFDSIQFIMKDVNIGYILRIFHIVGSSFYMLFLWLHLLRGLFIKLFFFSFISALSGPLSVSFVSFVYFPSIFMLTERFSYFFYVYYSSFILFILSFIPRNVVLLGAFCVQTLSRLPVSSFLFFYSSLFSSSSLVFRIYSFSVASFDIRFVNSFYFTFYYVYFIGIIIFIISIGVSFIGYTLVFGNLSYYGVIGILGIVSSLPSLLLYFFQFLFLFFSFLFILLIIVFLFLFINF